MRVKSDFVVWIRLLVSVSEDNITFCFFLPRCLTWWCRRLPEELGWAGEVSSAGTVESSRLCPMVATFGIGGLNYDVLVLCLFKFPV